MYYIINFKDKSYCNALREFIYTHICVSFTSLEFFYVIFYDDRKNVNEHCKCDETLS